MSTTQKPATPDDFNNGLAFLEVLQRIATALEKQTEATESVTRAIFNLSFAVQDWQGK